jgi:hypothetical protein
MASCLFTFRQFVRPGCRLPEYQPAGHRQSVENAIEEEKIHNWLNLAVCENGELKPVFLPKRPCAY